MLLTCLGNAFATHGLLGSPQMQLDSKVGAYQITLGHVTVDADSIVWLITQNQRREGKRRLDFKTSAAGLHSNYRAIKPGFAPLCLGAISGKKAYFQETSKLYEEALCIYTIERTPGKWAEVSNNYGMVLLALGEQAGTDAPWTVRSKISERLWVCADGNPFPCCGPKPSKT